MSDDFGRLISKMQSTKSTTTDNTKTMSYFLTSKKKTKSYKFHDRYTFSQTTDRILESSCYHIEGLVCNLCKYTKELDLAHLPEIVFANNELQIESNDGNYINFNTFDSIKMIDNSKYPDFKVSMSDAWVATRKQYKDLKISGKPFDWSYTTFYKGTVSENATVVETTEEIDIEKLKRRDPILEYDTFLLYEDELHDNGLSKLEIKYRIMEECFLVLQRFFLRVDDVIVRVIDTRLYHDVQNPYLLREWTFREQHVRDMSEECLENIKNEDYLAVNLPLIDRTMEQIVL
uniref:TIP41-like protein n=1 Tax=Strongyloides papillosus TaxID=174720 RepID=A0A0N5CHQ0_STREA